ncbi:MAG TPA: hypothetical protein VE988_28350 [Gemmataceae bacterium]|nr:hypothetical protein [Gemmataceae bacterium]
MAVSTPTIHSAHLSSEAGPSFYEKLNTKWHERALQIFMAIVLIHWGEHLFQAYQIYVMGWPRPKANGMLGLFYPWLVKSEVLHYGYALVIQFWHHIEHLLLITQATIHYNFWGKPVPFSVLQLFFPRVELHLFYNSVVFIPMVIGMYYHMFPPVGEQGHAVCTCEWRRDPAPAQASA